MAYRWVKSGVALDLLSPAGRILGFVVRSFMHPRTWLGWVESDGLAEGYPTRAAAMRAVASRTDPKKGFFAA